MNLAVLILVNAIIFLSAAAVSRALRAVPRNDDAARVLHGALGGMAGFAMGALSAYAYEAFDAGSASPEIDRGAQIATGTVVALVAAGIFATFAGGRFSNRM